VKAHPKVNKISMWWDMIQVGISVYLIHGQRKAIIDTGPPQIGSDTIASALETMNLGLSDIDLILNTHGHLDHTGGNAAVKSASHAQLCIHKDDAFFCEDREKSFDEFYGPPIGAMRGEQVLKKKKETFLSIREELATIDCKLEDNELIDLGDGVELRVIHLPGHSPGSVGYYWEKEAMLFSGDSVPGLHTISGELPIITDFPSYEKSVKRLMGMPIKTLFCGHPFRGVALPPCERRDDDEVMQYLQDSLEIANLIGTTVSLVYSNAHRALKEITDEVIDRLPAEMGFKPLSELPPQSFSVNTVFWCLRTLHNVQL
jgi:glyoxylase-like metal-dependent hydrolase (beta-lactamase superfamily II)